MPPVPDASFLDGSFWVGSALHNGVLVAVLSDRSCAFVPSKSGQRSLTEFYILILHDLCMMHHVMLMPSSGPATKRVLTELF